jgi:pectate lyase
MKKSIFTIAFAFTALFAVAADSNQDKPFGFCTQSSRTDASATYNITGGGCHTYPVPEGITSVTVLESNGQDMKADIQNAIKQYDVIILDGSKGDFIVSSNIGFERGNKTLLGINNARLCTKWYVTDEIKTALDAAGVPNMSTSGGGGTLSNGKVVKEEAEFNTRKIIIDKTGDSNESYRNSGILTVNGKENIIIRNITFVGPGAIDVGGSDLVSFTGAKHCWVDHCEFIDGMDGNFDITNSSDFNTVSWCIFRYTDRSYMHQNTNLIGSSDSEATGYLNTTFAFNWWGTGCRARMPMARAGKIHMLNNYYSCANNSTACINPRKNSEFLIEGNYFAAGVKKVYSNSDATAATWKDDNVITETSVSKPSSHGETVTVPYTYTVTTTSEVPTLVKENAGATIFGNKGTSGEESKDLVWDYTENKIPTEGPDNGLYYAGYVNDAPSTNMKLNGVKLNSSGYAFFGKPAVAGKLTLTFGNRKSPSAYTVNVYACTIAEGQATKGDLIGEIAIEESPGSGSLDIAADVTGIYIERKTSAEGVLQKIVFKENKARTFVDFEIPYEKLSTEFDPSVLPAGVTFQGTKRGDNHGYGNVTINVPVDGTVKFTIGGCQYANPATCKVTNSAGELLAEPNLKTTNCYHQDKSSATYIYTGAATTLTFSNIAYLPYFKAEATEVSEVTITYKDQNGNQLGTKKVYEGDEIGEIPYTEANLTVPEGYKFRGWVYTSGVKVKSTDIVTGNVSVNASVTAIETAPTVGSVQTYNLTQATFYPEDHELFSVTNGKYHNDHGFDFAAEGSFTVDVAGKAQVVLTLCQYGSGTTIEVKDAKGNVIQSDLAAKSTSDGGSAVLKYDGNATQLTFTFASQTYLHAVTVYNVSDFMEKDAVSGYYIIHSGDAASLIMALNSASAEEGAKIFLPNGTYDFGEAVNTPISGKNVSIIGQSAENTIIVSAPPVALEGLGKADLLVNTGEGLYLQDLTLKNALDYYSAGSTGRAPTLHDKGTKTINKNVRHLSYQDTYYSHKTGGVYYFEGGEIHGTVDYMCGNGKVYFNEVNLVNEKHNNATMSANSELYVYNNCTVKQSEATQFNFGRAWSDNPVCIYLNTTLEEPDKLISTRWNLDGINCDYSKAGEYGTKNSAGENITPATNTVTFKKANTELQTILDASALETYSIGKVLGDWATTAQEQAKQIDAPADAKYDNGTISWTASNGASAYAIFKDGVFAGITTGTSYNITVDADKESLTIRAANARGGFGKAADVAGTKTGIDQISSDNRSATFYNLQGMRVGRISKGIYITNGKKVVIR